MDTKLAYLKLTPWLLDELNQLGYEVVGDMQHLPAEEMLRIPGMGGTLSEDKEGSGARAVP